MKNKKQAILFFGIALSIVFIDQFTKWLIRATLPINAKMIIVPNFLNISHILNTGAGFGLFKSFAVLLMWISIIVAGVILYYYPVIVKDKKTLILCSFILGGTIGNLIDRAMFGAVIDFVYSVILIVFFMLILGFFHSKK